MGSYQGNVDRFSGFAEEYDRYRFRPPAVLADLLCRYAKVERPALVVDLGAGTGLSSRFWQDRAERVIGVEPSRDMREQARSVTTAGNVEYRAGYGHETGLPDAAADLVTCSQSFHWMEPESTLAEVGRILRPGGVFSAYDYQGEAPTGIVEVDEAAVRAMDLALALEVEHGLKKETRFYGKTGHERALADSGIFRMSRKILLHNVERTSAESLVGGIQTWGLIQTLRKRGVTDQEMGITALAELAREHLGDEEVPAYVSYVVHVGVTRSG